MDRAVEDLHIMKGMIYVGGDFRNANQRDGSALAVNHIAGWNGYNWFALDTGTDSSVKTIESNNGILYAGGAFENAGNVAANGIARLVRGNWTPIGSGIGSTDGPGSVHAITVQDNRVFVGGFFLEAGGYPST